MQPCRRTLRPEHDEARLAYLAARDHWRKGYSQHPWPSFHGYRGFLLWNREENAVEQIDQAACAAFNRATTGLGTAPGTSAKVERQDGA